MSQYPPPPPGQQPPYAGDTAAAAFEIECARETLGEDVRNELGLYGWNREDT